MAQESGRGGQALLLLVLLAILAGGGGWNYKRNLDVELAEPRPYRGYAERDLEALVGAYQAELAVLATRYERATGRKLTVRERSFIGEQIEEFERVQRASRAVRNLGYEISEREAQLAKLEHEQSRRARDADKWKVFLRRVFTLPS